MFESATLERRFSLVKRRFSVRVPEVSLTDPTPLEPTGEPPLRADRPAVLSRGIERSLGSRQQELTDELNLIIEATYRVISRTESIDPPLREILREAGLSTPAFYRHFRSKDELLVGLLEQGWDILRGYLAHQMEKVDDPVEQVEAWIRGMLAQAAEPEAARRARPFVANLYRLAVSFPDEYRASRASLVDLLVAPVQRIRGEVDVAADVMSVYDLVKAVQERHLVERTSASEAEIDHLVGFVVAAVERPPNGRG